MPEILADVNRAKMNALLGSLDDESIERTCRDLIARSAAYMTLSRLGFNPKSYFEDNQFAMILGFDKPELPTVMGAYVRDVPCQRWEEAD